MTYRCLALALSLLMVPCGRTAIGESPSLRFERIVLTEEFHSEGTAVADIDGDGARDIVSGPFWYAGPEFRQRHAYAPVKAYSIKGYSDHFFAFTRDFNEDGNMDILSIPIPGQRAVWYENPGNSAQPWQSHVALDAVGNESPTLADITGDGRDELICIQQGSFGYAQPNRDDPYAPWRFTPVTENRGYGQFTHGLGVGDVDGDGRVDLLEKDGWWQQTETAGERFKFHPTKFAESGGSQMFVEDLDGDGDNDVVSVQNAHAYGLCWFERRGGQNDFLFVKHQILGNQPSDNPYGLAISQMHAVALADIDGDGSKDLITGKRFWAHGGADPGAQQLPVLYWLRTTRSSSGVTFEPHLIDLRVGVGTQLTVDDIDGNGQVDIVVGNKLGTFVLLNSGKSEPSPEPSSIARHTVGTDEFKNGVRTSEPLTPDQEQAAFVLPAGFEAQLVAAEPEIAKPMNMAFDAQGRLWVSSSVEYPYPAAEGEGRDTIKILEDTDGDGRADKVTTFADGLNIPIGLYPYGDGVICYSIPYIWYLRDLDHDGKADQREQLYGPFDYSRDTHGMCNAFTRGFDGWLYACHGFNNQSTVAGTDGHQVTMHSGNTFRMRLDGSRIEHYTHGQVNPFGMALDPSGDLLTADCHTKPITLLMQGGVYESFGKPHDGLGFVPNVMKHLHGSTAIGGIALYHADRFPPIYHGNAFGGNVMTSRINRNSLQHDGASVRAREEPDFLISGDPWFRPVDLQVGPDGALYVADFYNRIIGHYEVPLDHPGRDRSRGRIWRIVFTGHQQRRDVEMPEPADTAAVDGDEIAAAMSRLSSPNLAERMAATDQLSDVSGLAAEDRLRDAVRNTTDPTAKVHLLWILHRLGANIDEDLVAASRDTDRLVRNHTLQVIGAMEGIPDELQVVLIDGLSDPDPRVRRSAAMAAAQHPSAALTRPLMRALHEASSSDVHLRHAIRMALRDQLQQQDLFLAATASLDQRDAALVADMCLAIKTDFAGEFLAEQLSTLHDLDPERLSEYLAFAARYAAVDHLQTIADMAQQRFRDNLAFQEELLRSVRGGLQQRGRELPAVVIAWANGLARQYLGMTAGETALPQQPPQIQWTYLPHPGTPDKGNPWVMSSKRNSADGQQGSLLHSSFPRGESLTGIYRSDLFRLPAQFSFFIAGHDGFPDKPINHLNLVRVRDAQSQTVLKTWSPPRNDIAQRVNWDTGEFKDRDVFVELVDGDTATAYAWLAVGRFSVAGLNPSLDSNDRRQAAQLIADFRLKALEAPLQQLLSDEQAGRDRAADFARALVALEPTSQKRAIAEAISIVGVDSELRGKLKSLLLGRLIDPANETLGQAMKSATAAEQQRVAQQLSSDQTGLEILLQLIEAGQAAARLLTDPAISAKLNSIATADQTTRSSQLVESLPAEDLELIKTMQRRKASFLANPGNPAGGAQTFAKQCGVCHQVAGKGTAVGPNLDGIGNRGLDRVLEDVMTPNRNIDAAFRASVVLTDDGQVVSGLVKPSDGEQLIVVDQTGKQVTIPTDSVIQQKSTGMSPMPANLHETLDDAQTRDLLAYLLSLTH